MLGWGVVGLLVHGEGVWWRLGYGRSWRGAVHGGAVPLEHVEGRWVWFWRCQKCVPGV